jgi:hypothetical protein
MISCAVNPVYTVDSAWETQASWCHGRFGAKSAPQHRDFAPRKEEVI